MKNASSWRCQNTFLGHLDGKLKKIRLNTGHQMKGLSCPVEEKRAAIYPVWTFQGMQAIMEENRPSFFIFWEKTHLCCVGRKPRWATSNPPLPSLCSLFKTQHDMWHTIKRCKVWACVCKVRWVGGRGGGLISLTGEYKQNKHAFMLRRFLPRSLVHTTAPHLIRLVFLSGRPERSLSSIPPVAGALTW